MKYNLTIIYYSYLNFSLFLLTNFIFLFFFILNLFDFLLHFISQFININININKFNDHTYVRIKACRNSSHVLQLRFVTYVRVVWRFNTAAVGNARGECACPNCVPVGVPTGRQCSSTPPPPPPPLVYIAFNCNESTVTSIRKRYDIGHDYYVRHTSHTLINLNFYRVIVVYKFYIARNVHSNFLIIFYGTLFTSFECLCY